MQPFLEVLADGRPVNGSFYTALKRATIVDAAGQESDSFEVDFDNSGGLISLPREGTILSPRGGFRDGATTHFGDFKVAGYEVGRSPDEGRYLRMTARPADIREDIKEPGSEHWDDTTVGDVVGELAERHGLVAAVDPALASIAIPYIARYDQSALDFLTRLGDRFNAIVKPAAGRLVFMNRGGGTLSGGRLPPIVVRERDCSEWSISGEPRPQFGKVEARWLDRQKGTRTAETATSGEGPKNVLRTLFGSAEEALAAAESEMARLNRATGSGNLTLAVGRPSARAEADVRLIGFGEGAEGAWRASNVEHEFGQDGYQTRVEFEAKENGRPKGDGGDVGDSGDGGFADGFTGEEYL